VLKHKWQELKTSCKAITQIVQYDGYKINKIVDGIDAVEGVILNSLNSYYHHLHMQISNYAKITYANIQSTVTTKQTNNFFAPNVYNKTKK
jgi:uncharacterized protein YoxC